MTFGIWNVISEAKPIKKISMWTCRCECGKEKDVAASSLKSGTSSGCGSCGRKKHGMSHTGAYKSWCAMMYRTSSSKHIAYNRYGGRGITVCDRWHLFENFYEDMGERPNGKTLDRIDYDGNYSKENCRWATYIQQSNNTSFNHVVIFNDTEYTIAQLSKHLSIKYTTLRRRIITGGVLDAPIKSGKKQEMRKL